ncbi:hypothetical protein DWF00_17320 [Bosea caraganae]|uniref:Uncharacterized protein n=1 Tax=Bosea caraganae TaxID=2763117 RepID=A0A370L7E4_9HYPH|nr:hypothetical protein DWF00_17320 [Bosea caraganae]RDJ26080.1 hypothetical protein DWE98_09540 [Bosea caraganae]
MPDRAEGAIERFRHLRVERFSTDRASALGHSHARNGHVVKVLCHLALMRDPARLMRPLSPLRNVTCTAAERQFFSAPDGLQAAHLLPGQIKIDAANPWTYLRGDPARRLENLFAYVEPLHANFNKADSAAESNGLTDAFAIACRQVLVGTGAPERDIETAYLRSWLPGARQAFEAAAAQKRGKPVPPPIVYGAPGTPDFNTILNLEERAEAFADESLWNVYEQLSVLDYYKASLDDTPRELQPHNIAAILTSGP